MRIVVVYKPRHHSYDLDWLDAFKSIGAEITENPTDLGDLTVLLHSVTAQGVPLIKWRPKNCLILMGNEFKDIDAKKKLALELNATIGTQLVLENAKSLYKTDNIIEIPHALNPDRFQPCDEKKFQIGNRGAIYKNIVRDDERNRISDKSLWSGLTTDIEMGKIIPGNEWAKKLRTWKSMPSTEGGMVGAKCITSRHFDAIGSHTCLVMYQGYFNGILDTSHYIELARDHSNLDDVKYRIKHESHDVVKRAREYIADTHTHHHRINTIKEWYGSR
jgi:hypothetical protein